MSVNVLALDGGGIRGIIPAAILQALVECAGAPAHEVFDLIAGTSTGGIIALAVGAAAHNGAPAAPADLIKLYVEQGPSIFHRGWWSGLTKYWRPEYSPRPLEAALAGFFGEARFASALKPLLIASYDLATQLPFFFKSHRIAADRAYDWPLREIARATSAAPTYFPPLHLARGGHAYTLVDGGVFANNPAMAAYAEARRLYPEAEVRLVSIGTGDSFSPIADRQARGWGLLQWAEQIVPVMMDGVSEGIDYELRQVLRPPLQGNFFRLQPRLSIASSAMDDASPANLANLQREAAQYLEQNQPLVEAACAALRRGDAAAR